MEVMQLREGVALAAVLICGLSSLGYPANSYEVPRTEYGQPDFQGSWGIRFSTPLERYEGLPLVLSPEAARGFIDASHSSVFSGNTDPDIDIFGPQELVIVKGEFSLITGELSAIIALGNSLAYPNNSVLKIVSDCTGTCQNTN